MASLLLAEREVVGAQPLLLAAGPPVIFRLQAQPGSIGTAQQLPVPDAAASLAQRRPLAEALGQLPDLFELARPLMRGELGKEGLPLGGRLALAELKAQRVGEHRAKREQRPALGLGQLPVSLHGDLQRLGRVGAEALNPPVAVAPVPQVLAERRGVRAQPLALGVFLAPLFLLLPQGFVVGAAGATEDGEEINASSSPASHSRRASERPMSRADVGGGDEHLAPVDLRLQVARNERARFSDVVMNRSGGQ